MPGFKPHAFGFIGTVFHPDKAAQKANLVRGQTKAAMAIYPAISVGLAPGGLFVDATQVLWDDALVFLLFMPFGALGAIHHFIGTYHPISTQVQEITER
jgi:hypothetical protein